MICYAADKKADRVGKKIVEIIVHMKQIYTFAG